MKTNQFKLLLSCGALVVLGATSLQGCSSSDDSSTSTGGTGGKTGTGGTAGKTGTGGTGTAGKTGTGGSGTAGSSTAGTSAGGTSAEAGEPGAAGASTGGDHPTADECTAFCAMEDTVCTGENEAYPAGDDCNADCAAFALGDDTDTTHHTPQSGDTFACRAYHLYNASLAGNAQVHCPHTAKISHNANGTLNAPCAPPTT